MDQCHQRNLIHSWYGAFCCVDGDLYWRTTGMSGRDDSREIKSLTVENIILPEEFSEDEGEG